MLFTSTVPTNDAEDDDQDLPEDSSTADHADDVIDDPAREADEAEAVDTDTEALQRSQDALDEGRDAASEALKDRGSDDDHQGFGH